jgi:endogenous inhibitor of DNA gyrase (YacG/DUF329 family)
MIRARCPTCSKQFEIPAIDALASFPFCCDRCRLIDLGRWIDGSNAVPGPAVSAQDRDGEKTPSMDDEV